MMVPAAAGAAAALTPAIELLNLFRENTELFGRKFDIGERTLHASLAGELISQSVVVSMPALFPTGDGSSPATSVPVRAVDLFKPVLEARRNAMKTLLPQLRRIAELDELLGELERAAQPDAARISETRQEIARVQSETRPALVLLEKADAQFGELQSSMSKVDEKTGLSRYARFVRASDPEPFGCGLSVCNRRRCRRYLSREP